MCTWTDESGKGTYSSLLEDNIIPPSYPLCAVESDAKLSISSARSSAVDCKAQW